MTIKDKIKGFRTELNKPGTTHMTKLTIQNQMYLLRTELCHMYVVGQQVELIDCYSDGYWQSGTAIIKEIRTDGFMDFESVDMFGQFGTTLYSGITLKKICPSNIV